MPKFNRAHFKHNAKVFDKICVWCGTEFFASRSQAQYCSSTCRGYASQARKGDELVPWPTPDPTIEALMSQVAFLKGQLTQAYKDIEQLKAEKASVERRVHELESSSQD
jgi:hypothetical protein